VVVEAILQVSERIWVTAFDDVVEDLDTSLLKDDFCARNLVIVGLADLFQVIIDQRFDVGLEVASLPLQLVRHVAAPWRLPCGWSRLRWRKKGVSGAGEAAAVCEDRYGL